MNRRGRLAALGLAGASMIGCLAGVAAAPAAAAQPGSCEPGDVQFTTERPWGLDALDADGAWATTRGAGVTVAVVDSGIDAGNPHLAAAVVGGVDLVGDGEPADGRTDPGGHGTVIAGVIAARAVAGSGVVGIAPEASLLSVRVFRGTDDRSVEAGFGPDTARLAAGIRWAAEHGADVINVSLSLGGDDPVLRDAVGAAHAAGALVVASAGNRGTTDDPRDSVRYPAGYDEVLGVAAADRNGIVDASSIHGPHVDLAAPGGEVLSSATGAGDCTFANSALSTSWATGYASGSAALVAAAHPKTGPDDWRYRLTASAVRSDPDARDDRAGWGFVQPTAAFDVLVDGSRRGPATSGGVAPTPVAPPVERVTGTTPLAPLAGTVALAGAIGIPAAGALATLGCVLVLRRRRAEQAEAPSAAPEPADPVLAAGPGGRRR